MELLEIIDKFNYKNIIVIDDEDFLNPTIGSYIDETLPIYEYLVTEYGFEIVNKKISDCDLKILELIENYIDNPYKSVISIRESVNFIYKGIVDEVKTDYLIDGNTIWFVDIRINNSKDYNHIHYLYNIFLDRNKNQHKNDIFILFSNEASSYDSLESVNNFFKDKVKINLDDDFSVDLNTNFIEKSKDINAALIYELILKSSKSKYFDLLKKSIRETINGYKESIYNSEMNLNLFHYDYLTEGQPFDDILYNVFQSQLKNKYNQNLNYSIFSYMNDVIDHYLLSLGDDLLVEKVKWRIARVINDFDHPFFIDTTVNILRHDLYFGDVFLICGKYYMLSNQLCDLTIRETGQRVDTNALLIPMEFEKIEDVMNYKGAVINNVISNELKNELNKSEISNSLKIELKEKYGIDCKGSKKQQHLVKYSGEIFSIKYNSNESFLTLPFWCLDNVCCNDDGCVDFNFCLDGLRYPLKLRIMYAEKVFNEVKEKLQNGLTPKEFLSIVFLNTNDEFEIKRIGKLHMDYANEVYRGFVNHQTRTANQNVVKF